jgi:hypothetical protein
MALINREENGVQTEEYGRAIGKLAQKLREGNCLIFLGAGASLEDPRNPGAAASSGDQPDPPSGIAAVNPKPHLVDDADQVPPSLPDGKTLARELLAECGLSDPMTLQQAASHYEFFYGRDELNKELVKRVGNPAIPPSRSIHQLVDFLHSQCTPDVKTVAITTNYDRQFELAYKAKFGEEPKIIIYKGATVPNQPGSLNFFLSPEHDDDGPYWQPKEGGSLYKLHGCITQTRDRGLVVTEEDYINFLANAMGGQPVEDKGILNAIKGKLENSTVLFLGYSLSDWNFQVLYKVTAERRKKLSKSYAVQFRDPSKPESSGTRAYWQKMSIYWGQEKRDVEIINARASEFTWDLLAEGNRKTLGAKSA